mgnify:CR=1 FL=1
MNKFPGPNRFSGWIKDEEGQWSSFGPSVSTGIAPDGQLVAGVKTDAEAVIDLLTRILKRLEQIEMELKR